MVMASVILRAVAALGWASLASAAFAPAESFISAADSGLGHARRAMTQTTLASSLKDNERRAIDRKYSRKRRKGARLPKHSDEVVGITAGLGLWGDMRRRAGSRHRRLLQETWGAARSRRSGRRRAKLVARFRKYFSDGNTSSSAHVDGGGEEEEEVEFNDDDDEADLSCDLDAMRARAGVIRTRVRLRQESLAKLERLRTDVKLEMRRIGWTKVFDADAGYTNRSVFMYGQNYQKQEPEGKDTNAVMNENELAKINQKWEMKVKMNNLESGMAQEKETKQIESKEVRLVEELQLDRMEKKSLKLQQSILLDRIRLQRLERRIICFESNELGLVGRAVGSTLTSLNDLDFPESNPLALARRQAAKIATTFGESSSVLLRKLDRVRARAGPNNREYASVTDFVARETAAGVRIVGGLLRHPDRLSQLVDPDAPALVPHVPAILSRLDRLESHVTPILSRVLNNKQHLRSIEPYLDEILERFDDIEPHLPWILDHIDTLAPYTGLLLKHIDELLLYAKVDEYEAESGLGDDNYAFAEQLLPYLEVYVSQLDLVGPHLPLLRPHLPLLLKYNRIKILSPHVGVLFAKGYTDLSASANMDILLFYFGWALRIPLVPRIFFALAPPSAVSFLANRMPKRLVRGESCDVVCCADGDYGKGWNELSK